MKTFGDRVRESRKKLRMTQPKLAKLTGLSQATISDIERGRNKGSSEVAKLAKFLKVSAYWLSEGKEDKFPNQNNIEPAQEFKNPVPLISWVKAGEFCGVIDNFQPSDAEEWLLCPFEHSSESFALRVRGESMYNPHGEDSFKDGELIFIDPIRQPINGSYVIVRLERDKEATFKQLIIDGDKRYLKALNPAWPNRIIEITEEAVICGVVFFSGNKY